MCDHSQCFEHKSEARKKKTKFWKVISPGTFVWVFFLLVGKNGTGTVLGKLPLK